MPNEIIYLLWSNKHQMWWADADMGYTDDLSRAGRYIESEAVKRVVRSAYAGSVAQATLMVAAPENWIRSASWQSGRELT